MIQNTDVMKVLVNDRHAAIRRDVAAVRRGQRIRRERSATPTTAYETRRGAAWLGGLRLRPRAPAAESATTSTDVSSAPATVRPEPATSVEGASVANLPAAHDEPARAA